MSFPESNSSLTTKYVESYLKFLKQTEDDPKYKDNPSHQAAHVRIRMSSACSEGHLALDVYLKSLDKGFEVTTAVGKLGRAIAVELYTALYGYLFERIDHKSFAKRKVLTKREVSKYLPTISFVIGQVPIRMKKKDKVGTDEAFVLFDATSGRLSGLNLKQIHIDKYGSTVKYHKNGQSKARYYKIKDNKLEQVSLPQPEVAASLKGNVVDIVAAPETVEEHKKQESILGLYRAWCQGNDFAPSDQFLAHFNPERFTSQNLSGARSWLKKEGFEFEKIESGYKVVKRPEIVSEEEKIAFSQAMKIVEAMPEALKTIEAIKAKMGIK